MRTPGLTMIVLSAAILSACAASPDNNITPANINQTSPTTTPSPTPTPPSPAKVKIKTPGHNIYIKVRTSPEQTVTNIQATIAGQPYPVKLYKNNTFIIKDVPPDTQGKISYTDSVKGQVTKKFKTANFQPVTLTWTPSSGTYGIGMPVKIVFSSPVPASRQAGVQSQFTVRSKKDLGPTTFAWLDNTTLALRPKTFWPAHNKLVVKADLNNYKIAKNKYTARNYRLVMRTSRGWLLKVTNSDHKLRLYQDDKLIKTFPISMGKPGYTSRSGIKVLADKYRFRRMTNEGVTTDEVYDLQVPYAMRLTDSGEFLHAAPWNPNIGVANTSHGCTNMQSGDAAWVYARMKQGDPVVVTGTGRPMETWNGLGGYWNYKYKTLKKLSAGPTNIVYPSTSSSDPDEQTPVPEQNRQ